MNNEYVKVAVIVTLTLLLASGVLYASRVFADAYESAFDPNSGNTSQNVCSLWPSSNFCIDNSYKPGENGGAGSGSGGPGGGSGGPGDGPGGPGSGPGNSDGDGGPGGPGGGGGPDGSGGPGQGGGNGK